MNLNIGKRPLVIFAAGLLGLAGIGYALYAGDPLGAALREALLAATGFGAALAIILLSIAVIGREVSRRRRTDRELRELKERFRLFDEGLRDSALMTLKADGTVAYWSGAAERLQGFGERDVVGKPYSLLFPASDVQLGKPEQGLRAAEDTGEYEQVGHRIHKSGSLFQARSVITPLRDGRGGLRGFSVVTRDVTEQRRSEELLKKLALTVEQAADLVVITDRTGKVEYVNRAVEGITGYARDEFIAGGMALMHADERAAALYTEIWETALAGRTFQTEAPCIKKNGETVYLDEVATPIKDGAGRVTHVVFTGSDLTPIRLMQDKLDYLASYDALTGLPNRTLLAGRLCRELAAEKPCKGPLAVLAIDIDRFKYLNETYGLDAGNKVLKQVAESLSVSVNKGDTVGRLGSDEFGIVLHDVGRPSDVVLFVKMIMKNVPQIIMSGGEEIPVTLAIGIAVYPADGTDAPTLMKNADTALSKAKDLGRNRYQFYTPDMNTGISELVFMERRLTDALMNKEYVLSYQPYYHLSTKKVAGAEALLRWNNDEFGLVSPVKFIPLLEETGMITGVGEWVLMTTCRQIREWTNGTSHLPISVNLSPTQFRHEYLVETVEKAVRELGVDPRRLTLEITESIFMKDHDFVISVLRRLKNIGVSISIDDFGTGYSSLSYLKKFPVDSIKIDQSFVKDVAADPDTTSLVAAIITMAHGLNLKTIAEGVETEQQWNLLRLLKCDMAQGFYFSPAVSAKEFEKLLA
jgi:diguanylate cyclase (GGDEF)-like protein/PAS domain S-box-containing protein